MLLKEKPQIYLFVILLLALSGCAGVQSYPNTARAGDTTAVATGWKHGFDRNKITVTITPSSGSPIVLLPGDPAVRAVINLYPDPVSNLVVSDATNQDTSPYANSYAYVINYQTNNDKDWWQTVIFIDLPATLPPGTTSIDISSTSGETYSSTVNIIAGTGQPESFDTQMNGSLSQAQLESMERADHFISSFDGTTIPYAIQAEFSHSPDAANGGTGKAYVVNPEGNLKNILWKDDGVKLRVLLTPTHDIPLVSMKDFKFYIAGGITGLQLDNVIAIDMNGNPVTGVSGTVTTN